MGAYIRRVQARAASRQQGVDASLYRGVRRSRDPATRDPGLIRDDDDGEAGRPQSRDRSRCAGHKRYCVRVGEVALILDDRAVAIEKDGATATGRQWTHESAATTALWKPTSSRTGTVRRSNKTCSSATRATMGGVAARSRCSRPT